METLQTVQPHLRAAQTARAAKLSITKTTRPMCFALGKYLIMASHRRSLLAVTSHRSKSLLWAIRTIFWKEMGVWADNHQYLKQFFLLIEGDSFVGIDTHCKQVDSRDLEKLYPSQLVWSALISESLLFLFLCVNHNFLPTPSFKPQIPLRWSLVIQQSSCLSFHLFKTFWGRDNKGRDSWHSCLRGKMEEMA